MNWKNQLRKAPFGPFKRKKPEPQPTETPEEAKKREVLNLIIDATSIVSRANGNDFSVAFGDWKENDERTETLNRKMDEYRSNNYTHMGEEGIEGLKRFLDYLDRTANSNAIKEGARQALSFVEKKEGELQ